jgi:D-alanine--D-alanine ligase
MGRLRVGVLRGGPSDEYEVSLKTGRAVLDALDTDRFRPVDVFIDRRGQWHVFGIPKSPARVLNKIDVAFNALHGQYGEDGRVQHILARSGVPYTGSSAAAAAKSMNKISAKSLLREVGIAMPQHVVYSPSDSAQRKANKAHDLLGAPVVVKPIGRGSSIGVSITYTRADTAAALEAAGADGSRVLIEERVRGREATCGILRDFRGARHYSLLPVEIQPHNADALFDYGAKYEGESLEVCPGNFSWQESIALQDSARRVHVSLGLGQYSRSDFILSGDTIYFLEVNTLPGLSSASLLPRSVDAVGSSLTELVTHVITTTR